MVQQLRSALGPGARSVAPAGQPLHAGGCHAQLASRAQTTDSLRAAAPASPQTQRGEFTPSNPVYQALGTFILSLGW